MVKDCKCKNSDEQKCEKKHSGKKHSGKKHSDKKKCCPQVEKSIDCCNPAYQRLASIRTIFLNNSIQNGESVRYEVNNNKYSFENILTRTGQPITLPDTSVINGDSKGAYWVAGPDNNSVSFSRIENNQAVPNYSNGTDESTLLDNAFTGYLLANKIKYSRLEECSKRDQVFGWYVDTNKNMNCYANVQLFQPYMNIPVNATLANLWNCEDDPTKCYADNQFKCYKDELVNLLTITNKALAEIGDAPKTEGNIVVVKDRKHKWLLLVVPAISNLDVCSDNENTKFVVFGVILC